MKPRAFIELCLFIGAAAAVLGGRGITVPPAPHYATADSTDLWQQGRRLHPTQMPSSPPKPKPKVSRQADKEGSVYR